MLERTVFDVYILWHSYGNTFAFKAGMTMQDIDISNQGALL